MGFRSHIWAIALLFSISGLADTTCAKLDESVFTLYVYGDSDARTLMSQRCAEARTAASQGENMECHCYDRALGSLLNLVAKSEGPIPLVTKKLSTMSASTCQEALQKCEQACQETAKSLPKPCSDLKYGGITFN